MRSAGWGALGGASWEGEGAGRGYPRAALHGHTRLLKSSGRDHGRDHLEVGPRPGSQRTGASGARAPSPPAGVGRAEAAVPRPAGRGLCPGPAVNSPNGGSRGGASAPSALPSSPLRRSLTALVRGGLGFGGGGGGGGGAATLSRGGGRAFLASRPAGSVPGLYGPDERGPTTRGRRSAQDRAPGKLHPGSLLIFPESGRARAAALTSVPFGEVLFPNLPLAKEVHLLGNARGRGGAGRARSDHLIPSSHKCSLAISGCHAVS